MKILLLIYFVTILFCIIGSYIKKDPQTLSYGKNELISDPVLISMLGILVIALSF